MATTHTISTLLLKLYMHRIALSDKTFYKVKVFRIKKIVAKITSIKFQYTAYINIEVRSITKTWRTLVIKLRTKSTATASNVILCTCHASRWTKFYGIRWWYFGTQSNQVCNYNLVLERGRILFKSKILIFFYNTTHTVTSTILRSRAILIVSVILYLGEKVSSFVI